MYNQFQKRQVNEYCKIHQPNGTQLPVNQLILHETQKLAFCYVPKSACTTFKILILHTQGLLPDRLLDYDNHKQPHVIRQVRKTLLKTLAFAEQEDVVREYFKFVMFRHCLLYTSPSPRDATLSRMPSSA